MNKDMQFEQATSQAVYEKPSISSHTEEELLASMEAWGGSAGGTICTYGPTSA